MVQQIAKVDSKAVHAKHIDEKRVSAINKIVPGMTSVLKSYLSGEWKGDLVQAASNVIQNSAKTSLLEALSIEWEKLQKAGEVKDDFADPSRNECLIELLDSLDKDLPDQKRFEAMKKILFKAASSSIDEKEALRISQLIKSCRNLNGSELLILETSYRQCIEAKGAEVVRAADQWPYAVASASDGFLTPGIVEKYEDPLIDKKIIAGRINNDKSGIGNAHQFRLTIHGMELGKILTE